MSDLKKKMAEEICFGDASIDPKKWFAQEINNLALKFAGLDEIPILAVLPLAHLSANGPADEQGLARAIGIGQAEVTTYLEALCEFKFVKECATGYEATEIGEKAFSSIGQNVIIRKRFEMKNHLEHLDQLYKKINEL